MKRHFVDSALNSTFGHIRCLLFVEQALFGQHGAGLGFLTDTLAPALIKSTLGHGNGDAFHRGRLDRAGVDDVLVEVDGDGVDDLFRLAGRNAVAVRGLRLFRTDTCHEWVSLNEQSF